MHRRLLGVSAALRAASSRPTPLLAARARPSSASLQASARRPFTSSALRRAEPPSSETKSDGAASSPVASPADADASASDAEATASESVVAADKSEVDPLGSDAPSSPSSSAPPAEEPTASEATVAAEKSDVDPLASAPASPEPAPTASEATVAAEKSEVDPLAAQAPAAADATPAPTASEETVAAEKTDVDPLKGEAPAAAEPAPTASEEAVAAEKSEVDPLAADAPAASESAPTASEETVAAEKSDVDPLAVAPEAEEKKTLTGLEKLKRDKLDVVTTSSGVKQLSQAAPTMPSCDQRALRTEPKSLLVREYLDLDLSDEDANSVNKTIAAHTDPFAKFDPTFLSRPAKAAVPYAPREPYPAGKKYGTDNDQAYAHLPPVSYFAVWPALAARPLARTILEEATRLELAGDDHKRVVQALDRIKYSTVPSDMDGALKNPDGQKMLRVVLLHRHDTYFAPEGHVIRKIWDKYGALAAETESPEYEVEFDYMLWDDRASVIAVRDVRLLAPEGDQTDAFFTSQQVKNKWALPANTQGRFFMELSNSTRDTTYPIDLFGDFMKTVGATDKASQPEFGRWGRNDLGSFLRLDGLKARGQFRGRVWDYLDGHEF